MTVGWKKILFHHPKFMSLDWNTPFKLSSKSIQKIIKLIVNSFTVYTILDH